MTFLLSKEQLKDLEYTPVFAQGEFDHTHEIYMQPRGMITSQDHGMGLVSVGGGNTGAWVITPFVLADTK